MGWVPADRECGRYSSDKLSMVLEDKTQRTTLKKGGFDMIGKMAKTRQRRHLRQLAGFRSFGNCTSFKVQQIRRGWNLISPFAGLWIGQAFLPDKSW
jgi:hypothetical protein